MKIAKRPAHVEPDIQPSPEVDKKLKAPTQIGRRGIEPVRLRQECASNVPPPPLIR
jgi:hypothetical protein